MKYAVAAFYFVSYAVGFFSLALLMVQWQKTKEPAYIAFLWFMAAYMVTILNINLDFLLYSFLGMTHVWSDLEFHALRALCGSWFTWAVLDFTHALVGLRLPSKVLFGLRLLAVIPGIAVSLRLIVEWILPAQDLSWLTPYEILSYISVASLVYNTVVFLVYRGARVDAFLGKMVRAITVLNLVFFPIFVIQTVITYRGSDAWRFIRADNGYLLIGSLVVAWYFFTVQAGLVSSGKPRAMLDPTGLSERELEVVRRVVAGDSNKEISARLNIHPSTVKNHLYRIYKRTGARSRFDLIRLAGGDKAD